MAVPRDKDHTVNVLLEGGIPVRTEGAICCGSRVSKVFRILQHAVVEAVVIDLIRDSQLQQH